MAKTSIPSRMFLGTIIVGFLLFLTICVWGFLQKRSLAIADQVELRNIYDRWVDAGRPQDGSLNKFMIGREQRFLVNTQTFTVQGTNFIAQFAITNPLSGQTGTLIISTNKVLLLVTPNRQASVVDFPY